MHACLHDFDSYPASAQSWMYHSLLDWSTECVSALLTNWSSRSISCEVIRINAPTHQIHGHALLILLCMLFFMTGQCFFKSSVPSKTSWQLEWRRVAGCGYYFSASFQLLHWLPWFMALLIYFWLSQMGGHSLTQCVQADHHSYCHWCTILRP